MKIFTKDNFTNLSKEQVEKWINKNYNELIGSATFTNNSSITSKLVQWAESWRCKDKGFKPSHTGSIIEYNNSIYIFDMKPLKARVVPLLEYIVNTNEDYVIILRDFKLDKFMFSKNIAYHIGEFYPFISAITSVFTKANTKYRTHCSELHLRELQKQGIYTEVNPEITPDELYHIMSLK